MTLNIQYSNDQFTALEDGVFIPVANLPGITASELASTEPRNRVEGKVAYSLCNAIFNFINGLNTPPIGISASKETPEGVDRDIFSQTFELFWQKMVNTADNTISQIPLPTTGLNINLGAVILSSIFPDILKVSTNDVITEGGIVIPTTELASYSNLDHASLVVDQMVDNREWLAALFDYLAFDSVRRTPGVVSAITSVSVPEIGAVAIPAAFTSAENPLSGILQSERPVRGIITRSITISFELRLNQFTQTFDVNA